MTTHARPLDVGGKVASVSPEKNNRVKKNDRVTVRLTGEIGDAISEIQEVTRAPTPSDVVRRALIVYHTLVKEKMAGNEPVILDNSEDGGGKIPIFL